MTYVTLTYGPLGQAWLNAGHCNSFGVSVMLFLHNLICDLAVVALENGTYEAAGRLLAYSIVHRGPLPTFLSEQFYAITLCESNYIGHLPDAAVPIYYREKLREVSEVHVKNAVINCELATSASCSHMKRFPNCCDTQADQQLYCRVYSALCHLHYMHQIRMGK